MTETEALRYAIDWLRALPASPSYAERRAAAVEKLAEMLADREQEERAGAEERRVHEARRAEYAARGERWLCDSTGLVRSGPMVDPDEACPECEGGSDG